MDEKILVWNGCQQNGFLDLSDDVYPWDAQDLERHVRLRDHPELTLEYLWDKVVAKGASDGPARVTRLDLASWSGFSSNVWEQQIARARKKLAEKLDVDLAQELFPHWRGFGE